MLVPFDSKKQLDEEEDEESSGCCAGQTAHHLIPDCLVKTQKSDCPDYKHGEAPTVCAEGTSHSRGGSHEELHTHLLKGVKKARDSNNEMTYKQAKGIASDSQSKTFKEAGCDPACIEAQLDNYFKSACEGSLDFKVRAVRPDNGKSFPPKPSTKPIKGL